MELASGGSTNVLRFRNGQAVGSNRQDQKCFMDAVYAAGALPVAADDVATKRIAVRLTIFGFVMIDEVLEDGTLHRLKPSEAFHSNSSVAWVVSKPSYRPVGDITLVRGGRADLPRPIVA